MFLLSLTRLIKFSLQNFSRNIWLSIVTITILVLTLFSLTSLIILNAAASQAILTVKNKIDISLYFPVGAKTEQAQLVKEAVKKLDGVKEVEFISAEEALQKFQKKHENDPLIQDAIKELGDNPLGPTLTVKANDVNLYPTILNQIKAAKIDKLLTEIDYDDHKLVINKLEIISEKVKTFGLAISGFFAIIALLIVFNTVRIGIYTHRDEIGIMKLVGASNWFIRGPFLLEAVIYALVASVIFWLLFYLMVGVLQPVFANFFVDINFNLLSYLINHLFYIFGFELIVLIALNMISSFIAIGKYLRV